MVHQNVCLMVKKMPYLKISGKMLTSVGYRIVSPSTSQTPFEAFSCRLRKAVKQPVHKIKDGSKAHLFPSPCHVCLASVPVGIILREASELALKSQLH